MHRCDVHDPLLDGMAGEGGLLGRGGMVTKLRAARLAARSGTETIIASGRVDNIVAAVTAGANVGTWLRTGKQPQNARKQWLAGMVQVQGSLELDDGAVRVLRESGRSLLAVGCAPCRAILPWVKWCPAGTAAGGDRPGPGQLQCAGNPAHHGPGRPGRSRACWATCAMRNWIHRDNLVLGIRRARAQPAPERCFHPR